jgi:DNA-binding transcriptional ArsR family regulator
MNTLVTSNAIEPPEATESRESWPEPSRNAPQPSSNGSRLRNSRLTRPDDTGVNNEETAYPKTDECTYETYETDEADELQEAEEPEETKELEEREEVNKLSPELWFRIYGAISECDVSDNRNINRPLFMLAHKVRSVEEELNGRFPIDVTADIVKRWQASNQDKLENDHDYLAEFLCKLDLVRFPQGRALTNAVEVARNIPPPKQTELLSAEFQLLGKLCCVLQDQAGNKPFFLDGRSAATALGISHRTVAIWLHALRRLGLIILVSQGRRGKASRYRYVAQA